MTDKEIMAKLQAPFMASEIEWRVGSTTKDKAKGLALAYVTNRAIQNRLDDVFGCFGWRNEFKEWRSNSQICGISIKHGDDWITKWDGADDSNMEATKGGLSDAMKRAAYQWGIGRYLYKLPQQWVSIEQKGNSYVVSSIPKLPSWALPNGIDDTATKTDSKIKENERQLLIKEICKLAGSDSKGAELIQKWLKDNEIESTKELTNTQVPYLIQYIKEEVK